MLAASLIIVAALLVEGAKLLPMFTGSWRLHRGSPVIQHASFARVLIVNARSIRSAMLPFA